jgi:hypothetical protein
MPQTSTRSGKRVRLRPHDAFDLIRLLARSQSDPRKAVAELVQNSLDAGARRVELTWFNKDGERALRVRDDGKGVFPDLSREDALRRIAQTIGYSHKRKLTPAQRKEQMVLGKYGIGLIGFWSVGRVLEMKSRVGGDRPWTLRLVEDQAQGEVGPDRSRKVVDEETWTQVSILGIHPAAVGKIRPPRLQAYLANELRGQLLERGAVVRITDRVARGRARKEFVVEPRPYLGRPLESWRELDVPGFESARLELYAVASDEERRGIVALACGGTVVLDDIAEIDGIDQLREPWSLGAFEGVIDFPDLHVAPGARRGFAHDEPVAAFLEALGGLEHELRTYLEEERRRRSDLRQAHLARRIRKAFRRVASRLPSYDFFSIRGRDGSAVAAKQGPERTEHPGAAPGPAGEGEELAAAPASQPPEDAGAAEREDGSHLFPPGPLAQVQLHPRRLALPPLATRSLRARCLDADGRPCAGEVETTWGLRGPGELRADGDRATYTAPDLDLAAGARPTIRVVATQGEVRVEAEAPVRIPTGEAGERRTSGIPAPHPVSAPGEGWRSRLLQGRWEFNVEHRDYLEASGTEAGRVRYLSHLLAKEVVLRNFGGPADAEVLERMVEVLTYLDATSRRGR